MTTEVTIGIPTYRAEKFIDRTLLCARAQSHKALRIVVSVDPSDDLTVEVCQRHAREDPRVEVLVQRERLGWTRNANAVLERFDTPVGFLYFHDDIVAPDYVEKLLGALADHPGAASAHCDLVEFGLVEGGKPAHDYDGSTLSRLIDFMLTRRGTTLRSLIRTDRFAEPLRFPQVEGDGAWAAYVFHLRLLVAGPAVAVHEPLYRRWQRNGSLTRSAGWHPDSLATLVSGQRQAAALCLDILDRVSTTTDERKTARYCLKLFQLQFFRHQQLMMGKYTEVNPEDISMAFAAGEATLVPGVLDASAAAWVQRAEAELAAFEEQLARARRASAAALWSFNAWTLPRR